MKSIFAIALAVLISVPALASDSWDSCSSSDGSVTLNYGTLSVGKDEITGPVKVLSRKVVEKVREECKLKNSEMKVVVFDNEVSLEKISYTYMNTKITSWLLCERGGAIDPAGAECEE